MATVSELREGGAEVIGVTTDVTDPASVENLAAAAYDAYDAYGAVHVLCNNAGGVLVRAAVFYPSGKGLLDTGLWTSDRNRPSELARERPRSTAPMTVEGLRTMAEKAGRELPVQPLEELADLVVAGIRDGRFVMILPMERTEQTLRSRLDKVLRNENPTEVHDRV